MNILAKPGLYYWYGKNGTQLCEQIKKESQEFGTLVHDSIHKLFLGQQIAADDTHVLSMTKRFWSDFVDEYEVKPLAMEPEEPFVDDRLKLQGTFDAVIQTKNGVFMADWKTSNSLDKISVPLQLAAYAHLWNITAEVPVTQGVVVRLDKKADKIQIKWYPDLPRYLPYFFKCLELAHFVKGGLGDE